MLKERIVSLSSRCTGCRACEVVCGFHRTEKMDPHRSSIKINKKETAGIFQIEIDESCDVCHDRETPACIQICGMEALALGRIRVAQAERKRE